MITTNTHKRGFGISEILGIAVVLIIAATVLIPGLRDITDNIMTKAEDWVDSHLTKIFDTASTP